MDSMASHYLIAKIFCSLSDFQKKLEELRQILSECEAFEPYAAFQRLDRASQGFLSIQNFVDFLESNNIQEDVSNELFYVLRPFDANGDDRITYRDFLNFILPQQSPTLRKICTQRPTYQVNDDELLPLEIEMHLSNLIMIEVDLFKTLESLKKELTETQELDLHESFAALAGDRERNFIDLESLKKFINEQGIDISEEDLVYSMLRLDRDQDGELTYTEFVEFILPISPYTRIGGTSAHNISVVTVNRSLVQNDRESPQSLKKIGYFDSYNETSSRRSAKPNKELSWNNRFVSPKLAMDRINSYANESNRSSSRDKNENLIELGDLNPQANRDKYSSARKLLGSKGENVSDKEFRISEIDRMEMASSSRNDELNYFSANKDKSSQKNLERTSQFPTVRKEGPTFRPDSYEVTEHEDGQDIEKPVHVSMNIEFSLSSLEKDVEYQIKDVIEEERSIKETVRSLMSRRDFNIIEFYRIFDDDDKGFIDVAALDAGLKVLGVHVSKIELYSFFKRYDSYQRGSLRFTDFCNIFTTKGHSWTLGDDALGQRASQNDNMNTKETFIKAISLIINYESNYFLMQRLLDQLNDEKVVKRIFSRLINKKIYPKLELEDINQIAEKLGLSHYQIVIKK